MNFLALHQQEQPLLLANVWDVPSAKAAEKAGFKAIGTSSAAVASMLGYADGEEMSFEELLYIVSRIAACTTLPLSVDLEAGYSREATQIVKHIEELISHGVVGINFEDSYIIDGKRTLEDANRFAERLKGIRTQLDEKKQDLYINVRIDTFILKLANAKEEATKRCALYAEAGASGLFVPYAITEQDISAIVTGTKLPVNVLANPSLPDITTLQRIGVKRISMGNSPFANMSKNYVAMLEKVSNELSLTSLFV